MLCDVVVRMCACARRPCRAFFVGCLCGVLSGSVENCRVQRHSRKTRRSYASSADSTRDTTHDSDIRAPLIESITIDNAQYHLHDRTVLHGGVSFARRSDMRPARAMRHMLGNVTQYAWHGRRCTALAARLASHKEDSSSIRSRGLKSPINTAELASSYRRSLGDAIRPKHIDWRHP